MKQTDPQMRLRLPHDVKSWIENQARTNLRSLNAEVVAALKEKMATAGASLATEPAAADQDNTHEERCNAANT